MLEMQLNLMGQLAALVGAEYVRSSEEGVVVAPRDTQQVSEVLKIAHKNGMTVRPFGGKTKELWGGSAGSDVGIDLTRLDRVVEHPWQDLTCTVQAGCKWQQLQLRLANHGQFVALDPLWPERATVGGVLAVNDSGALRHRYGSLRDLVIGMTLVLADGTIARSGGKVVKNVAGYDLCKLMTGSMGTLAMMTEATFRLHPLPRYTESFTVTSQEVQRLSVLMQTIRASHLLSQALQLRGGSDGFQLDIKLNAHPEARQSDLLREMTEAAGLSLDEGQEGAWQAREEVFRLDEAFTLKLTMLPTAIADVAAYLSRRGARSVIQSLGIAYVELPAPDHNSVAQMEGLEDLLEKHHGSITILKQPGWLEYDRRDRLKKPATYPLMQRVKHQFDPDGILNPGCFLGGM